MMNQQQANTSTPQHGARHSQLAESLRLAAEQGQTEIVNTLLDKGADPDTPSKNGNTALVLASLGGDTATVKLLLDKGADPNRSPKALEWAIFNGYTEIVKLLLNKDADPNTTNQAGDTPLALGIMHDHTDIIKNLLGKGANPNTLDKEGSTALMLACCSDYNDEIVTTLIHATAAEGLTDVLVQDVLVHAAQTGRTDIVKSTLEKGANPNAQTGDGYTALNQAARNGHPEIVNILLEKGANPNAQNEDGNTAFNQAARNGHTEIANILLDKGAEPWLLLTNEIEHGHTENAQILRDAVAKPCTVTVQSVGNRISSMESCCQPESSGSVIQGRHVVNTTQQPPKPAVASGQPSTVKKLNLSSFMLTLPAFQSYI